ncbi:Hypothetical predicted protein [Paramuricea clavata]|uniref:Uncharacterized protein n=1 Tax=Paramuricea clavata TaxID=317549 RepID=A0A6S7IIT8_PARCT|nr:Hypothetical predicted protein [Paramuricea clavata]
MSSEIRLKEGELTKYKNMLQGWKNYHFKLESSYLHYYKTKYTREPLGTTTRGKISKVTESKDNPLIGFEIHLKSGEIWKLKAANHEEKINWMTALKPDSVDLFKSNAAPLSGQQASPSVPPQEQPGPPPAYEDINFS